MSKEFKGAGLLLFRYRDKGFEVLLGANSPSPNHGKWTIPWGRREPCDKDYRACAERELLENTGIDIKRIEHKYCSTLRIYIPFFHWRTFIVMARGRIPEPHQSDFKWVHLEEVHKYNHGISLEMEIRYLRRYLEEHDLQVAKFTGMPYEDDELLTAYRILSTSKDRSPSRLQREMGIGHGQAEALIQRIRDKNALKKFNS